MKNKRTSRRVRFGKTITVIGRNGSRGCEWHAQDHLDDELGLALTSSDGEQRGLEFLKDDKRMRHAFFFVQVIVRRCLSLRSAASMGAKISVNGRLARLATRHARNNRKMALRSAQRDQIEALKIHLSTDIDIGKGAVIGELLEVKSDRPASSYNRTRLDHLPTEADENNKTGGKVGDDFSGRNKLAMISDNLKMIGAGTKATKAATVGAMSA